jgi:dipeptide/tripeptide permease
LKKFSARQVTIFGSVITGSGLVICAFAEQYWHIVLGYSFLVGFGSGLVHPATFLALDSFFTTKKTRAMGFSHAGASIGHIIIPNIVTYLLENYGFRKTVLAKGALSICGIVGGLFFQPVEKYMIRVKVDKEKPEKFEYKDFENELPEAPKIQTVFKLDQEKSTIQIKNSENVEKDKRSFWANLGHLMDLKLLKRPQFLIIGLGIGICFTVTINFAFLLPFFLQVI